MKNTERPVKDIRSPEETKREYCKRILNLYANQKDYPSQSSADKKV